MKSIPFETAHLNKGFFTDVDVPSALRCLPCTFEMGYSLSRQICSRFLFCLFVLLVLYYRFHGSCVTYSATPLSVEITAVYVILRSYGTTLKHGFIIHVHHGPSKSLYFCCNLSDRTSFDRRYKDYL